MSLVLDHSVALPWCFEGEQTLTFMDLLDRVAEEGVPGGEDIVVGRR